MNLAASRASDMFDSPAMREVWPDKFRTQKYLDWEAALARAEAKVGLISQQAAYEITRERVRHSDSAPGLV